MALSHTTKLRDRIASIIATNDVTINPDPDPAMADVTTGSITAFEAEVETDEAEIEETDEVDHGYEGEIPNLSPTSEATTALVYIGRMVDHSTDEKFTTETFYEFLSDEFTLAHTEVPDDVGNRFAYLAYKGHIVGGKPKGGGSDLGVYSLSPMGAATAAEYDPVVEPSNLPVDIWEGIEVTAPDVGSLSELDSTVPGVGTVRAGVIFLAAHRFGTEPFTSKQLTDAAVARGVVPADVDIEDERRRLQSHLSILVGDGLAMKDPESEWGSTRYRLTAEAVAAAKVLKENGSSFFDIR